jgi:hypothetical protein
MTIGGKAIDSGGFGCIFKPALKCETSNNNNNNSNEEISKLMITKYAQDEFNAIQKYKYILNRIPNYKDYFLLDHFVLCKPDKLTKEDLIDYGKKCKNLKKRGFTTQNINKSLDKMMSINMPNGGMNISIFIDNYFVSSSIIINLNQSLIELLTKGIIPMNKLNVYHCDIKDTNVLVQFFQGTIPKGTRTPPFFSEGKGNVDEDDDLKTRLIDWGLSVLWKPNQRTIPHNLFRRPFQFNVPFSSILFNEEFSKLYSEFLINNPTPTYFQLREFVINYIFIWNDIRGPGHLSSIHEIIRKLTIDDLKSVKHNNDVKNHVVEYEFTYYYIVEYLTQILETYTNNGELRIFPYFKNVFLKNIDIWGFTMIYMSFYEYLYDSLDELNHYQLEFISKIKYIIVHFLFENPLVPINVNLLVTELTNLNKVIEKFHVTPNGGKRNTQKRRKNKKRTKKNLKIN